jgi:magnesium-transporting ATPase (P-type)
VLHVFDFSAQLARMGTLVELPAGASQAVAAELGLEAPSAAAWSFVKGAPEVLAARMAAIPLA